MDDQTKKTIMWVIIAIVATLVIAWLFFGGDKDDSSKNDENIGEGTAQISGELIFDALTPEKGDDGSIEFAIRTHNTGDVFAPATLSIAPSFENGGTWMIKNLETGTAYDIQATLVIGGKDIVKSNIATATAPADDVALHLVVTWNDLPEESIKESKNKTISGTLKISGYIPEGAFYGIWAAPARDESDLGADEVDDPKFTRVLSNLPASTTNSWTWNEALAKVQYRIKAELYTVDGDYIGTSNILDAEVPQNNVALGLQSSATTEPTTETLSGTVSLHGSYESDSKISVEVRENGAGGFTEIESFPAESSRKWAYNNAKKGIKYDIRAVLKKNGEEVSKSKQVNTTAPDSGIELVIDTGMNIVAPPTKPEVSKCSKRDDGDYDVTLKYPGVNNAELYWIRVGKEKGSADKFNEPEGPDDDTGSATTIKLHIKKEKYYYTDYAYSYCKDCTTLDSFSEFSDHLKFYCGDEPDDD